MAASGNSVPPLPLGAMTISGRRPEQHHKKQQLVFSNGVGVIRSDGDRAEKGKVPSAARGDPSATKQPAWLAFDRQTLCFDAYFQEAVHEARDEHYRIRNCKIFFFPEDDTLEVVEPPKPNSGLPQGKILRRHRVPKPAPHDDEYYTVEDLNVASEVTFYGRTFMITSCDKFSRDFLTKLGIDVPAAVPMPDDPYSMKREAVKASESALRPYERQDKLKQFLDGDRKVLRFYCVWDETQSEEGDERRYMVLHHFLADSTTEIREVVQPNSGRDGPSIFLRRQKLPKDSTGLVKAPGAVTNRTLLNVFAPEGMTGGSRAILDNIQAGTGGAAHYVDSDFEIGAEVNVYGRSMLLCDCDEFTKNYYREVHGVEDFTPIHVDEPVLEAAARIPPPHTGIGTEEDSLASVYSLVPKPPKRELTKWYREGSNALQFRASLDSSDEVDADRAFAIVYYLADDTIAIFEERRPNSGMSAGKFMARGRAKAPAGGYYTVDDLRPGATLRFSGRDFIINGAAPHTLAYLRDVGLLPEEDNAEESTPGEQ